MKTRLFWSLMLAVPGLIGCASERAGPAYVSEAPIRIVGAAPRAEAAAPAGSLLDAPFTGKDRKHAKTSIVHVPPETFASLQALVESLPDDDEMTDHEPPIAKKGDDAERVEEEDHAVVVTAWIYASRMESDKDFHLIVGDDRPMANRTYLTCEVSALPRKSSSDYATLRNVRQQLKDIMGDFPTTKYKVLPVPIKVKIEGSLFFDVDHPKGSVGTGKHHPDTAWEIHPVTSITHVN